MRFSIITPVWNQHQITTRFLRQVAPRLESNDAELIVIDNGSVDRTPHLLGWADRHYERVQTIRNTTNCGFGPACNQGILCAKGNIIVLINNDVEFRGPFLEPLERLVQEHPKTIVTGQLVDWNGGWNHFFEPQTREELIVSYGSGWFLGTTRLIWKEVGLFDTQFVPCDYEDMDWSMRAATLGYDFLQFPKPQPFIHHSGQTGQQLLEREEITKRHRQLFAEKWGLEAL